MKNPTFYLIGQSKTFAIHLDEFRQEYSYSLLSKDGGRFEIRHNDDLLEILVLSRGENLTEVQTAGSVDIYKKLGRWLERKKYAIEFESPIDAVALPVIEITHPIIEQFAKQQTDNPQLEVIRQSLERFVNKQLPELPANEETKSLHPYEWLLEQVLVSHHDCTFRREFIAPESTLYVVFQDGQVIGRIHLSIDSALGFQPQVVGTAADRGADLSWRDHQDFVHIPDREKSQSKLFNQIIKEMFFRFNFFTKEVKPRLEASPASSAVSQADDDFDKLAHEYADELAPEQAGEPKKSESVPDRDKQINYNYDHPTNRMTQADKAEAYLDWMGQDKFFRPKYPDWARRKFGGDDPVGDPKVPYKTLLGWKRYVNSE